MSDQIPKILYRVTSTGIEKLVVGITSYGVTSYEGERFWHGVARDFKPDFQVRRFKADAVLLGNPYSLQLERIYLTRDEAESAREKLDLPMVNPANLYLKNLSDRQLDALRLDFDTLKDEHLEDLFLQALRINDIFPSEISWGKDDPYARAVRRQRDALLPLYDAIRRECETRGIYLHDFYGEVGQTYKRVECTVEYEYSSDSERDEWLDFRLKTFEGNALLSERFSSWSTKPSPSAGWYRIGDRVLVDFTVKNHEAAVINEHAYVQEMVATPAKVTHVSISSVCYKDDQT